MALINRPGTIVRLPDGRVGTTVYNGLDGVGIKWGWHQVTPDDLAGTNTPEDWPWYPDAMLRDYYSGADLPCVGTDYEILAPVEARRVEANHE